jgi:hypothetical protein
LAPYLPDAFAPEIQQALDKRHALQDPLYDAGPQQAEARAREDYELR